jgi:hypothetical protein
MQDEINMFYGQIALEEELLTQANKLLICDTTFITIKIWCDEWFDGSPQEVLDELPKHPYDLYLLLDLICPGPKTPCAISPPNANTLCRYGIANCRRLMPIM